MAFDDAPVTVIETRVELGRGALAREPITVARVRDERGQTRELRTVGGSTPRGFVRLAGHVVPFVGAVVRADLLDLPTRDGVRAPAPWTDLTRDVRAWTPSTPAGTWPAAALPVRFVLATPGSSALGASALAEIDVALRTWAEVPCTAFRAALAGTAAVGAADDGTNAIVFHESSWPAELEPGALGQTVLHVDGSGKLRDADVHINAFEHRFALTGEGVTVDARGVLVHEIGHALGLGHSASPLATMAPSGAGLAWRTLEPDDVAGVCALYPGAGAARCPATACPDGYRCVGGACLRPGEVRSVCSPCAREVDACDGAGEGARCIDVVSARGDMTGRVCASACAQAEPRCPSGFSCKPTTAAGDDQCVPDDACRAGASPCGTTEDCRRLGHATATCIDGACMEPAATPAGDGGAPDASAPAPSPAPADDGCGVAPGPSRAPPLAALLAVALALTLARTRYHRRR